ACASTMRAVAVSRNSRTPLFCTSTTGRPTSGGRITLLPPPSTNASSVCSCTQSTSAGNCCRLESRCARLACEDRPSVFGRRTGRSEESRVFTTDRRTQAMRGDDTAALYIVSIWRLQKQRARKSTAQQHKPNCRLQKYKSRLIIFVLLDLVKIGSAGIAQLVERNLAKVEVAGSRPVSRSRFFLYGHPV